MSPQVGPCSSSRNHLLNFELNDWNETLRSVSDLWEGGLCQIPWVFSTVVVGVNENGPVVLSDSPGCGCGQLRANISWCQSQLQEMGPWHRAIPFNSFLYHDWSPHLGKNVLEDSESPTNFICPVVSSCWSDGEKFSILSFFLHVPLVFLFVVQL